MHKNKIRPISGAGMGGVLACAVLMLFLSGCGKTPHTPAPDAYQTTTVGDLSFFPQSLVPFAEKVGRESPLWTAEQTLHFADMYRSRFFSAWTAAAPGKGNLDYFRGILNRRGRSRGYAENLQPWSESRWSELVVNAAYDSFPSLEAAGFRPAITIRQADLRQAPTLRPRLVHPARPGQGFPFDEFQQSLLPLGMPVMVMHESRDGQWLYVETALVSGWLEAGAVARMDREQRELWQTLPLAVCIKDGVTLRSLEQARPVTAKGQVGTLLPLISEGRPGPVQVLVPARNTSGGVDMVRSCAETETFVPFPWGATAGNLALLGDEMMGQPYGWGGMYGNRDCSAMLRDLFTPFGLWLPRNSAAQAAAGFKTELEGLDAGEKERLLLAEGAPLRTLVWLPGHIMLYLGNHEGRAAMFHSIWGIRTMEADGTSGRHILGRAVVTSASPGAELDNVPDQGLLLNRLEIMTVLGEQ